MPTTADRPCPWQRLFPRYGKWGAPGYSAGRWNNDPARTDWSVNGVDKMDFAFKRHDYAYQRGRDRVLADRRLVAELRTARPRGLYARLYRRAAIGLFAALVRLRELKSNEN